MGPPRGYGKGAKGGSPFSTVEEKIYMINRPNVFKHIILSNPSKSYPFRPFFKIYILKFASHFSSPKI